MAEQRTILIIDDAADVRKILQFHLTRKGYKTLEAANGEEGLGIIDDLSPDLVILDINMPKMGGLEVYNKLSAGSNRPPFPVLILTTREELGSLFSELDVDGFINKPFNIEDVLREIDTIMSKRYQTPGAEGAQEITGPRKVLLVEDNQTIFSKIVTAFLNSGFTINSAKSGVDAIEKLMTDLPHIILIKLGLPDLSGDVVCYKLKQMPRTMDVPIVLYTEHGSTLDLAVIQKISEKSGAVLVESNDPYDLLKEAEALLKK